MSVTGSCAEFVFLSAHAPDYDRAISNEDLVKALMKATREVTADEFVEDVPPRGKDAIGL